MLGHGQGQDHPDQLSPRHPIRSSRPCALMPRTRRGSSASVLIFADGKGDSIDQAADLENAIAAGGVDGVLIAPNDIYALVPSDELRAAAEAFRSSPSIPASAGASREMPHVGIDNVEGGRILAELGGRQPSGRGQGAAPDRPVGQQLGHRPRQGRARRSRRCRAASTRSSLRPAPTGPAPRA